ncbi:MAG TPA: MATE family efflux transporter [Stellaceae bacterium]|nr:MATE family efflux transporter [Stellaceae bacterium]
MSEAVDVATSAPPRVRSGTAPRTQLMLEAPIVPTLLRLAWPNVAVMLAQAAVGLIEAYFVGWLGTAALAGVALVFPVLMLMQMMSGGAIGGGISSAIARALGGGRREEAEVLVMQAVLIALMLGVVFGVAALAFGPALYRAMGGNDAPVLAAALRYSNTLFLGAPLLWLLNSLSSVIRGTGNMLVPALVTCAGTLALLVLSPALIVGWPPFPRLEVAGGAVAVLITYGAGSLALALYIAAGRSLVRFRWRLFRPDWRAIGEILRVGGIAAANTVLTNLTIVLVTAMIGSFGAAAIAGYGIGSRLEYLLIPLVFGLGAPLVAMVGTNIGAGQVERAQRIAWTGAALAFAMTEAIGLAAALFPAAWIGLFDRTPEAIAIGTLYLHRVAPLYGAFGGGMALYFSSQGAGRMAWPFTAGVLRILLAAGGGWVAFRLVGAGPSGLFLMVALGLLVFGGTIAAALAGGAWERRV